MSFVKICCFQFGILKMTYYVTTEILKYKMCNGANLKINHTALFRKYEIFVQCCFCPTL